MLHLTADAQDNHNRFVSRVKKNKLVWGIKSDDGWAVCPSNEFEDKTVYTFWSDEAYARRQCINEWSHYVPTSIQLDSFINK
jgi:hypothetical protein